MNNEIVQYSLISVISIANNDDSEENRILNRAEASKFHAELHIKQIEYVFSVFNLKLLN